MQIGAPGAIVMLLATTALSGPAVAGCEIGGNGHQQTCTGSLPGGASFSMPIQILIVQDLDGDVGGSFELEWIEPGANGNGVAGTTASQLLLGYNGGNLRLVARRR